MCENIDLLGVVVYNFIVQHNVISHTSDREVSEFGDWRIGEGRSFVAPVDLLCRTRRGRCRCGSAAQNQSVHQGSQTRRLPEYSEQRSTQVDKSRKGISLHGLERILFCSIKDCWNSAAI